MAKAGGSANINGVLYQVLGTLGHAVQITLRNCDPVGQDLAEAQLIIEPTKGGDLQVVTVSVKRVVQFKARSSGGTWSLNDIVEKVLPDLYLAVEDRCSENAEFIFTTEGRIGEWSKALSFFQSLGQYEPDEFNLSLLDTSDNQHEIDRKKLTDFELFNIVCDKVTTRKQFANEPRELTRRKVCFLLGRFQMRDSVTLENLTTDLNEFLIAHVDFDEEVENKRQALCGIVLEISRQGDQTVSAQQILEKASLPIFTFRNHQLLLRRLAERLKNRVQFDQYDAELDVRSRSASSRPITIYSSESGQGKTWSLAALAIHESNKGVMPAWVSAHRGGKEAAEIAANELWKYGLDRDRPLTLDRIANRRKRVVGTDDHKNWAIVCIDDVTLEEAKHLIRLDWQQWGIKLAVTAANEVALQIGEHDFVQRIQVEDFSIPHLKDYMARRGKRWTDLAEDVSLLIRRPVLAKLFCDLEETGDSRAPESEFDLMNSFWKQIAEATDMGVLRRLARKLLVNDAHPWPSELLLDLGIQADSFERLKRQGWLRDFGDGMVGFWHLRLLCWALAQSLFADYRSGVINVDGLCEVFKTCNHNSRTPRRINLGYAPFDTLWLLLNQSPQSPDRSNYWKLIASLECYRGFGHEDEWLYENSFPTLGETVVPILLDRIKNVDSAEDTALAARVFAAISKTVSSNNPEVRKTTLEMLNSNNETHRELGLRLTARFPDASEPSEVWWIHCQNVEREKETSSDYSKQRLSAKALSAVCTNRLDWLDKMLASETKHLEHLAYVLANIESTDAMQLWGTHKNRLKTTISPEKRCSVVYCIHNFRDMSELDLLEEWAATNDEPVGSHATQALACLETKRVMTVLEKVAPKQFRFSTRAIIQSLYAGLPSDEVNSKLIELAGNDPATFCHLFAGFGDQLNNDAVLTLTQWLHSLLREWDSDEEKKDNLFQPLSIVAKLNGQEALETLRSLKGSDFERHVFRFAESRVDKLAMGFDWDFHSAKTILTKICGEELLRLTNRMLESSSQHAKLYGCELAMILADERTEKLLSDLSLSDEKWMGIDVGEYPLLQAHAAEAMAKSGFNESLVNAILKWGHKITSYIGDLRRGQRPMNDDELRPAFDLLASSKTDEYPLAILAIGQSGRTDMLPLIQSKLSQSGLDSDMALCSLLALSDLATESSQFLDRLIEQYRSGNHKRPVLMVMNACSDTTPENYLQLLPKDSFDNLDLNVLRFVGSQDATKQRVRELVRKHILFAENFGTLATRFVEELIDPAVKDELNLLWEHSAAPTGSFFNGDKANAIERLAVADHSSAYEIALRVLRYDSQLGEQMPAVLMKINASTATADLCRHLAETNNKKILRAIGIAFRRHGDDQKVNKSIAALLNGADWKLRRAVAFAAGFLSQTATVNWLKQLAYGDRTLSVAQVAQGSIRRHQKEEVATKIAASIDVASLHEAWAAIESITQLVDPSILAMKADPIGFQAIFEGLPWCFTKFANKQCEDRAKKIASDLDSVTNRWDD